MKPGHAIAPHLTLVRPLAAGSMGALWVAHHAGLRTEVAVKFISGPMARDPSYLARFEREAQVTAQIQSEHVARVFESGAAPSGDPYLVMELLAGESLRERIERAGPLSLRETAAVLSQIAEPLALAHALGIVHRDIKTANIFLVDSSAGASITAKLLDFGVAKVESGARESDLTRSGDRLGTPYTMSPEQLLSSKHVDHRADIWSLGVVAYFCLLGAPPFPADSFVALVFAVSRGRFAVPGEARPGAFSPAIDAWFRRALAKDPAHRFASAHEMARAFEEAAR